MNIILQDWHSSVTISAVHMNLPKSISKEDFNIFFINLDNKFLAGGDFNAKNNSNFFKSNHICNDTIILTSHNDPFEKTRTFK